MNWFLGFLPVLSLAINVLFALILADIRAEANCRWSPPSAYDGKPCCACDPEDPMLNCYEKKEANDG